jgi:hypothetical protein
LDAWAGFHEGVLGYDTRDQRGKFMKPTTAALFALAGLIATARAAEPTETLTLACKSEHAPAVKREAEENGVNDRSRPMPNETHLKRLISDAVFEAHNTHGEQAAGDRLNISREDSRIIAGAVFDALRRANFLLIDQPGQPNS